MTTTPVPVKHDTLIEALIAAQSEYPGIPKEATGQARGGRYQYATLPAVLEAVVPALNRNGIALIQSTSFEGESLTLHTILRHISGQEIVSVVPLPSPQSWQDWGSALTYARRYSITALAGVAPDVDDDGATAQGAPRAAVRRPADSLGWDAPPPDDAPARMPDPRAAAATAPKMPAAMVTAPHGACETHKTPWLKTKNGQFGHYFTPNPPRGDGKGEWCPRRSASLAEQAAQIAAERHDAGEGYRDVGPASDGKEGQGALKV